MHSHTSYGYISLFVEPWLKKTKGGGKEKGKKQKASENKKNFSIKPPPTSRVRDSKTKTGFNSKKLKFEPGKDLCSIL